MIYDYKDELPIGFGLSLAMNEKAMEHFSKMGNKEKDAVIEKSRQISSRYDMERLVENLAIGKWKV